MPGEAAVKQHCVPVTDMHFQYDKDGKKTERKNLEVEGGALATFE
jgi:hypothetical protein